MKPKWLPIASKRQDRAPTPPPEPRDKRQAPGIAWKLQQMEASPSKLICAECYKPMEVNWHHTICKPCAKFLLEAQRRSRA